MTLGVAILAVELVLLAAWCSHLHKRIERLEAGDALVRRSRR